jgi:SAM-dependent methyltransferase
VRDVVTGFYVDVLNRLIVVGTISISDRVLVVCGGPLDERVMRQVGFADFTITNLDENVATHRQNVENLTYDDGSFDIVVVHAGLHHCQSPHRALLEMYRVARKCAVAFESRDSLLMRAAVSLGLTEKYEVSSISLDGKSGGVADTGIPNFIYRWTERDVRKTIASYDPARIPQIKFFYDLRIPTQRFMRSGNRAMRIVGRLVEPLSKVLATLAPRQCNEFAFAVSKNGSLHPWIDNSKREDENKFAANMGDTCLPSHPIAMPIFKAPWQFPYNALVTISKALIFFGCFVIVYFALSWLYHALDITSFR